MYRHGRALPAPACLTLRRSLLAPAQIWKDAHVQKQAAPFLAHLVPGQQVDSVRFCPFEDVLFVGHSG